MKHCFIIIVLLVCALNASAQTYLEHLQTKESGMGSVTVHQSKELDALINGNTAATATKTATTTKKTTTAETKSSRRTAEEEIGDDVHIVESVRKTTGTSHKVTGYRVQVYAGGNSRNDKAKAERIGNEIRAAFPGHAVYVHFYSPRWICRMGNFRTYEDAQAMLAKVRAAGFSQASLVKGQVTVTN